MPFEQALKDAFSANPVKGPFPTAPKDVFLGTLITQGLNIAFTIAFFLTFFWLIWGALQYLFAGGDKDGLSKAKARITSAIIGLILVAISFALAQFIEEILQPRLRSPLSLIPVVYAADIIPNPDPRSFSLENIYSFGYFNSLGQAVNMLVNIVFSIAATAVVVYFIIGSLKYITSAGDKNAVSSGKDMITHSVVGFLLLIFVFLIMQYIPEYFGWNINIFGI